MLPPKTLIENITQQASRLLNAAESPISRSDIEGHLRALLHSALSRLDVVNREEFDSQMQVLARTRQRLEDLEVRVAELEALLDAQSNTQSSDLD